MISLTPRSGPALARAFDVKPGFAAVLDGAFLEKRSKDALGPVNAEILRQIEVQEGGVIRPQELAFHPLRPSTASMLYRHFAHYLIDAYGLESANSGFLEAGGVFAWAIESVNRANAVMVPALRPLEEVVDLFISGDGRPRTVDELRAFGWPAEDLFDLDLEWL